MAFGAPLGTLQRWRTVEAHEAFHQITLITGIWLLVEHSEFSVSSLLLGGALLSPVWRDLAQPGLQHLPQILGS